MELIGEFDSYRDHYMVVKCSGGTCVMALREYNKMMVNEKLHNQDLRLFKTA